MTRIRAALLATATLLVAGGAPAGATVIVRAEASAASVAVGDAFTLELRADVSDPVVGFGLDLPFDPALLEILGAPTLGPLWLGAFAPDGDGLAGLAPGAGISGDDLLLTTLVLRALAPGEATLVTTFTAGDLTEGFPLDPTGFEADVQHVPVQVMLVPEPGAPWLALALGASWGRMRRRNRTQSPAAGGSEEGQGMPKVEMSPGYERR